jgi:hypothetical protein
LILNMRGNNVGIGNINPSFQLDVAGGVMRIIGAATPPSTLPNGGNGLLLGTSGFENSYKWIQSYSGPLLLNQWGNRVGIGTTGPAAALDVAGGSGPGLWVRASTGTAPTGAPGSGVYLGMGTASPTGHLYAYDFAANARRDLAIQGTGGNVSIGHDNPVTILDIGGTNGLWVRASGSVGSLSGGGAGVFLGSLLGGNNRIGGDTAYLFAYNYGNNTPQNLIINSLGGRVGIGAVVSPNYTLHVNGTAAGTSWTNLSSRDYKEDIQPVGEENYRKMLDQLLHLDVKTYRFRKEFGGDGITRLGFIAEEMPREVLSGDGKAVDTYELLAYTIGALKAQQEQILVQRQEIERLKALIGGQGH